MTSPPTPGSAGPAEVQPGPSGQSWERAVDVLDRPFPRYLIRRILHGLLVVVVVAVSVFFVTRIISDPVRMILPPDATAVQQHALEAKLGLDEPVLVQFRNYAGDLLSFDLGESFWQRKSVAALIGASLPNTLLLVAAAMLLAVSFGVAAGVIESLRPGGWGDKSISGVAIIGLSLPHFWLGSMLILLGAVTLGWFPASGNGGISHLVLPALTLAIPAAGRISQVARSAMVTELTSQHITTARAKGLGGCYLIFRHALRNVMVPITTVCSWETVYAIAAYSIVVETVFAWPGIGQLVIQAIKRQDLILVQGIVIVIAAIVVVVNIATDVVYRAIDPRVEL